MTRRPFRVFAAGAAVALALTGCGTGSGSDDPAATPTETATQTATATATETGTATETETEAPDSEETDNSQWDGEEPTGASGDDAAGDGEVEDVPVYYLAEAPDGPALVREFRTAPDEGDLITTAIMAMMNLEPRDPDYSSAWGSADSVTVTREGDAITVDVPSSAFENDLSAGEEVLAWQQLVYTATAAAAIDGEAATTVTVLQDGGEGDAWGEGGPGESLQRASQTDVLLQSWVTSPAHGATVEAGEVTLEGYGASFEGNFVITLTGTTADGESVEIKEPTTSSNGTGFGTWEYTVELEPGEYNVSVRNDSGKDDFEPDVDDKDFTVE